MIVCGVSVVLVVGRIVVELFELVTGQVTAVVSRLTVAAVDGVKLLGGDEVGIYATGR